MFEKMKQVAVRMGPSLHKEIKRAAKRNKQSFSDFIRQAANDRMTSQFKESTDRVLTSYAPIK